MRFFLLILLCALCVPAQAETVVVRRRSTTVIGGSAQDAAIVIAKRGALVHSGCGQTEGIGFSTVSEDAAIRNCCYWGKRKAIDIGVARGARGWYAVVRYQ
jgi:hypothetical protein